MDTKKICIACTLVVATHVGAEAQRSGTARIPDITGSWERYRSIPGPGTGPRRPDPYAPPQATPPPLKPPYLNEWRSKVQAVREADAKGQPLANGYTDCLPDGMPSMMGATFPMEILQSRGQV